MTPGEFWRLLGAVCLGATFGFGAYRTVLEVAELEVGPRHSNCPIGQVALRVEAYPFESKVVVDELGHPFYDGKCLNQGRYGIEVSADRYETEHRIVQLGAADQLVLFKLKPRTAVTIDSSQVPESRKYKGEKLSANFNDIDVRSALQLIADFTDRNIIVANDVTGNLSFRIANVPWDQALDAVLFATGNVMVERNGVIYVSTR